MCRYTVYHLIHTVIAKKSRVGERGKLRTRNSERDAVNDAWQIVHHAAQGNLVFVTADPPTPGARVAMRADALYRLYVPQPGLVSSLRSS